MSFKAFEPVRPPKPAYPIQTTTSGECMLCTDPARVGALCREHFFIEASAGRANQWRKWYRRPGLYVPPIILIVTLAACVVFLGAFAFFLCIIIPACMYEIVYGRNRKGGSGAMQQIAPPMDQQQPYQSPWNG